ncbi:hypothetical protein ACFE04_019581 [Oxalis oulophora]
MANKAVQRKARIYERSESGKGALASSLYICGDTSRAQAVKGRVKDYYRYISLPEKEISAVSTNWKYIDIGNGLDKSWLRDLELATRPSDSQSPPRFKKIKKERKEEVGTDTGFQMNLRGILLVQPEITIPDTRMPTRKYYTQSQSHSSNKNETSTKAARTATTPETSRKRTLSSTELYPYFILGSNANT